MATCGSLSCGSLPSERGSKPSREPGGAAPGLLILVVCWREFRIGKVFLFLVHPLLP